MKLQAHTSSRGVPGGGIPVGGARDSFATAVAVHFTGAAQPSTAVSTRLDELRQLRERGLIDQQEYDQKRAEILRGL